MADDKLEQLRALLTERAAADDRIADHVRALRSDGYTWRQIGAAIGITQQGAYQRWGRKD